MSKVYFAFALLISAMPCFARTITVDDDGPADFNNIQAAVDDANNGDIIEVFDGSYLADPKIDLKGKSITVRSQNGPSQCVIYGSADGFVLNAENNADCVLEGLNFQFSSEGAGSSVKCSEADLLIQDCVFYSCLTNVASAVDCNNSRLKIKNTTFFNCVYTPVVCKDSNVTFEEVFAECCYGNKTVFDFERSNLTIISSSFELCMSGDKGVFSIISSNVALHDSSFIRCSAQDREGGAINCFKSNFYIYDTNFISCYARYGGGAIYTEKSIGRLRGCNFTDNYSEDLGGAICIINCEPSIELCLISGNRGYSGGGIYFGYGTTAQVSDCLISDNKAAAADGGGICVYNSSLVLNRNKVVNNTANDYGGGIYFESDTGNDLLSVQGCILTGNKAFRPPNTECQGGGGFNFMCGSNVDIRNSIIWQNESNCGSEIKAESYGGTCLRPNIYICYSDVNNGPGGILLEGDVNLVWGPGNINTDPCFVNPGYWDGDIWVEGDYHLQSEAGRWDPESKAWMTDGVTSPCIDAGDPNSDWTGELWPHGKRINMGAYGGTAEASMSLSNEGNIADLDNDDYVGFFDLSCFAEKWLTESAPLKEDLDRNGFVDFVDFAVLGENWVW